jgi:pyrroloquinoline quinone biosynthesis protein D
MRRRRFHERERAFASTDGRIGKATVMIDAASRLRLARGVRMRLDRLTGKTLLLRPEQGFELQGTALEIVQLCMAELTVGDIVDRLSVTYQTASREQIAGDVHRLLADLNRRGVIEVKTR